MATGGASINVTDSKIVPLGAAYGIEVSVETGTTQLDKVSVSLVNSTIDLSNSDVGTYAPRNNNYARAAGIVVNKNYYNSDGVYKSLESFSLDMRNSSIVGNDDPSISTINILLHCVSQVDIDIDNSSLTTPRNHYPILLSYCGSVGVQSSVNISDSFIKGWCGVYFRNGSTNIDGSFTKTTFECITDSNSGPDDDFSVFGIHSALNCSMDIDACTIQMGRANENDASMGVLCYQYNTTYGGNSSFNFTGCTFEWIKGTYDTTEDFAYIEVSYDENTPANSFKMDESSLKSLYTILEGAQSIVTETGIYPDPSKDQSVSDWGEFYAKYTEYYLSTEAPAEDTETI